MGGEVRDVEEFEPGLVAGEAWEVADFVRGTRCGPEVLTSGLESWRCATYDSLQRDNYGRRKG